MNMNLGEILLEYINFKKLELKESSIALYSSLITNYIDDDIKNLTIEEIKNNTIQNFCDKLLFKNVSSSTVKKLILIIKLSLNRYTKINSLPNIIIDIDLPKTNKKKKIKILSKQDQKALINYILKSNNSKYKGILLVLLTGIRIGELCALKWEDIDLKRRTIFINKTLQRICEKGKISKITTSNPKTENSIREIPISCVLYDYLIKIKPTNKEYKQFYFLTSSLKSFEPRNYRKIYDNLLKKLNIEHINFHSLRHTFATRLIENKVDLKTVSELLGHNSVNVTISIYVHSEFSTKRKAIKTLDNLIIN